MKNMLIKVLSVVMALTMIMGTLATLATAYEVVDHKHVYDEKVGETVPATCITPAYDTYACECGASKTVAVSGKLEVCAGPFETVAATDATCTEPGYLAYERCVICGKATSEKTADESKPALGHTYELVIEDPSCGEGGKIYDKCTRCGDIDGYNYIIDENGDNVYEIVLGPTYWNSDLQAQHTCERAAHNKYAYLYEVTKYPTCTENGNAKFVCKEEGCNAFVNVAIEAHGHDWRLTKYVAPDCETDGFRTYTCHYCKGVADAEHPELVEVVNAWLKTVYTTDDAFKAVKAGVITKLGHDWQKMDASENNCACVVGFDLDGDGKKPVLGAEAISKDPTCFSAGYQWYHCERGFDTDGDGVADKWCEYGKDVLGAKTHAAKKEDIAKATECKWATDAQGNKLYTYTIWVLDPATEGTIAAFVYEDLPNVAAAKAAFDADKTNTYGKYEDIACRALINAVHQCVWCNTTAAANGQNVRPIEHSWLITDEKIDDNDPICSKNAENYCTKLCERCGYKVENFRYYVAHSMALVCDDANCTGTKTLYDADGEAYAVIDWCNNCTHANRRYTCTECGEVSTAMGKTNHKWVKTEEKIPYFVHPDFGPVYETCMLPARYVYVCDNAFSEGFECECTTWHYNPADFSVLGGGIWGDADKDGKLDLDEIDKEGAHVSGEELSVGYDANGNVIGRGNIAAINRVQGHRPHATVDADGNTIVDATNSGITYKAPTCTTDGSVKGFCTWCSENINVKIPANAAYHEYELVEAEKAPTCMEVGYTAEYKCKHCRDIKGGEVIPVDYTNHVPGCETLTDASGNRIPTWIRPASCMFPYAEIYTYSKCGYQDIVEFKSVNPANHAVYYYDNEFKGIVRKDRVTTVAYADPTCTTDGTHTFSYCLECFYVVAVDDTCNFSNKCANNNADCGIAGCYDATKKTHACNTSLVLKDRNLDTTIAKYCAGKVCNKTGAIEQYAETLIDRKDNTIEFSTIISAMEAVNSISDVAKYTDVAYGKSINEQHVAAYYAANYRLSEINGEKTRIDTTETGKNNISDDKFEIPALGHDFWFDANATTVGGNILRLYLKETCTTPGHEWEITCSRGCKNANGTPVLHPELNGETIAPHGLKAENLTRVDTEKTPTCTEGGLEAGLMCKLCDTEDDLYSDNAAVRAHAQECFVCIGATNTLPAKGHDYNYQYGVTNKTRNYACETYTVKFYRCADCDYMVGKDFVPAEEHTLIPVLNADGTVKKDANGNVVYKVFRHEGNCGVAEHGMHCVVDGYTYNMCSVCNGEVVLDTIPAAGHKNQDVKDNYLKDYISFSCVNDEYLLYKGTNCEVCGHHEVSVYEEDYFIPALRGEVICGIQNANIDHNWVMTVVEGGCTAEGGIIYVCADCKVQKDDSVHNYVNGVCACGALESDAQLPILGHDFGYTVEYVPATPEKNGSWTWVCARCDAEVTETIQYRHDIVFNISVAPYVAGKDRNDKANAINFVNGGQIEVVISVTAEYFNFNVIKHVLNFDASKLSYVSREFLYDFDRTFPNATDDALIFTAWEDFANTAIADGSTVELVKYIFDVAPGVDYIDAADLWHTSSEIEVKSTELMNIYSAQTEQIDTIDVLLMGDVNVDGQYDGADVKLFNDYIVHSNECDGGEGCEYPEFHRYFNIADINYDGAIDAEDWFALALFINTKQTVADYYAMFGYDIYAMVDAYKVHDYTADGMINELDEKVFEETIRAYTDMPYCWYLAVDYNFGDFTVVLDGFDLLLRP